MDGETKAAVILCVGLMFGVTEAGKVLSQLAIKGAGGYMRKAIFKKATYNVLSKIIKLIGIKSTNFRIEESGDTITFYTVGYGHGVGMSQEGANQMALDGYNYKEIIKHYYTGVEISEMSL